VGRAYRSLLAVSEVRRLLLSSVLARLPLGTCSLAILLFVRAQTSSFLVAGLAVGAFALLGAAMAPLQGALIDRLGQVRVLVPCAAGQGLLLTMLVALGGSVPRALLIALAGAAGALTPPVSACLRVLWLEVTGEAWVREAAYALDAMTQEIIWVLGPLLVAATISLASPGAAVLMSAAITILGTALFASAPLPRSWRGEHERHARASALSSRGLRALLGSVLAMGATIGAVEVGLPALAGQLHSHALAGVLLALWSVGSMAGGVLYCARVWRGELAARHAALLAAMAILTAPLVLADSLPWAMLLSLLGGLAIAPTFSCQYSLVSALAPAGQLAEAFTWQTAALVGGIAVGSALAGALVDIGGCYLSFALGCLTAATACLIAVRGSRQPLASAGEALAPSG
jgi:MFS family permease